MDKSADKLNGVLDAVFGNPLVKAQKLPAGGQKTECNLGALLVARGIGCHAFDPGPGKDPYLADQLFGFFQRADSGFVEKPMEAVQDLVNAGSLVYGILNSHLLQEPHGHVVTICPGHVVDSASMHEWVPVCMNIATLELTARSVGINFAFPLHRALPRFFAWKETL